MFEPEQSNTGRLVTWNKPKPSFAAPSTVLLKAISTIGTLSSMKSKTLRRMSKAPPRLNPKLVFEYGPTSYRGLLLHRKIRIAPFAEHFQKKYPELRVFYHPITDYNRVTVKLLNSIVVKCSLSNLAYARFANITTQNFYKVIDKAIQRVLATPCMMSKPFRDPVCLMTHNLDIDYDYPWYRTPFPVISVSGNDEKPRIPRNQVSFDSPKLNFVAMHSQVSWESGETSVKLWDEFRKKVETTPGYELMLETEAPMLEVEKIVSKRKPSLKTL